MGTRAITVSFVSSTCLLAIITLVFMNCHNSSQIAGDSENSKNNDIPGYYEINESDSEITSADIQNIKDDINKRLSPKATAKDKKKIAEILLYLDDVQQHVPAYLNDIQNYIGFLKTMIQLPLMEARLNPGSFDLELKVASHYIQYGTLIKDLAQSDEDRQLYNKYLDNYVKTSEQLVEKFPANARSYSQLAHATYLVEGDTKKALDLYKKCLELDAESKNCKENYGLLLGELEGR